MIQLQSHTTWRLLGQEWQATKTIKLPRRMFRRLGVSFFSRAKLSHNKASIAVMCTSWNRNSMSSPAAGAGQSKCSRKRPMNRTEVASSLAAEAFLTQRPELVESARLLLKTTREVDELESAKASSAGTTSIQSRFLRKPNNDPQITEQKRTELLRQLYQAGKRRNNANAGVIVTTRHDVHAAVHACQEAGRGHGHSEGQQDASHANQEGDDDQCDNKKRKIHSEAWRGCDGRRTKKAKMNSKIRSVASRTA